MLKFFGLVGLVAVIVTGYLVTFEVGPDRQLPPSVSLLEGFREDGLLPENRNLPNDHAGEDAGAFEVPEQDKVVLAAALEAMGDMDMGGMNMGGMNMEGMDMDDADDAMEGMDMAESGEGGLLISDEGAFDRVVELTMTEWSYSDMQLDVTLGERIKLVVNNDGEIPHEFMFMTMSLMAAANYRVTRADWSLLEHEALFEQALILPGGSFEIIIEVQEAGSWMYMCMLPYHMQLGMMGQMATDGMAMDMNMQM